MAVLAVNAGSSSLKLALYPVDGGNVLPHIFVANAQGLEPGGTPSLTWTHRGTTQSEPLPSGPGNPFRRATDALRLLLTKAADLPAVQAVAHRVVHGGAHYRASVVIDAAVLAELASLCPLAPLHQPHNLEGIRAFGQVFAGVPQVACFDTAYHATLAEVEYQFALPRALSAQGVRRYGFHGLSYQFIMGELLAHSTQARGRVLMAHLGNGASLCAALDAQSCATTMGFTALDGLVMGTRCGALDPGVLLYLLEQGWDHQRLQDLLYRQSGLLGVSGISADMRTLRASPDPQAQQAIDMFIHHVVRESGALTACLGGLDVLAFSGGIGEHDAPLRERVCARLAYLGVKIDPRLNQQAVGAGTRPVHTSDSAVQVWVVPTDEGRVAAQEAVSLTKTGLQPP